MMAEFKYNVRGESSGDMITEPLATIAKKALALAMMREKSIVLDRFDLTLAMAELRYALGVDVDGEAALRFVEEKYGVGEGVYAIYIIVPDEAVDDVVRRLDRDLVEAMRVVLLNIQEEWRGVVARVLEAYATKKVRERYDRNWSVARELLRRATEAGFSVEALKHGDEAVYRITAPTGESASVYYHPNGCVHAYERDPLWFVEYRFKPCHSGDE